MFFSGYGINIPPGSDLTSKYTYSKNVLKSCDDDTLLKLAKDLGIDLTSSANMKIITIFPKMWESCNDFKLFISHLHKHKDKATRLKEELGIYGISSFVAHENINPTLEWDTEIERTLDTMDAMLCIHTKGFSQSPFTQQEIGFALGRKIKIISLKMGEDPEGLIFRRQALARRKRTASDLAIEIKDILLKDPVIKSEIGNIV